MGKVIGIKCVELMFQRYLQDTSLEAQNDKRNLIAEIERITCLQLDIKHQVFVQTKASYLDILDSFPSCRL